MRPPPTRPRRAHMRPGDAPATRRRLPTPAFSTRTTKWESRANPAVSVDPLSLTSIPQHSAATLREYADRLDQESDTKLRKHTPEQYAAALARLREAEHHHPAEPRRGGLGRREEPPAVELPYNRASTRLSNTGTSQHRGGCQTAGRPISLLAFWAPPRTAPGRAWRGRQGCGCCRRHMLSEIASR